MINLSMAEPDNMLRPRLTVIGVGGGGGNAINNMLRSCLEGCDFVAANTDSQALAMSLAPRKIQLGTNLSRGLGAGSKPEVGRAAAEETMADLVSILDGSDMLFVTAGMGGGTGTGAAPVIARAARESGILTVGVVTKPFHFEGAHRMRQAESGIAELQQYVDTLIVIPNQNLFRIANERTTFAEAFRMADEVLHSGVRGITDLMVMPGFMNLDFADVKTVMAEMGKAMMGTGESDGENRALRAAEAAISNPLLDDISMKGARGVLINITGGLDMTLFEVDQAANRIREEVDPDAQIKVGSTLGEGMDGRIRVSVIATGIDAALEEKERRTVYSAGTSSSAVKPATRAVQEPVKSAPIPTAIKTSPVTAAPNAAPVQAAPAVQQQQAPAASTQPAAAKAAPAYFTMPTAISPATVTQKVPSSSVAARSSVAVPSMQQQAAPTQQQQIEPEQEDEAVTQQEMMEDAPVMTTRAAASRQPMVAAPPVREIPPVQQAQRQKTAPLGSRSEVSPDPMRVTQLTTASGQPKAQNAPVNQRAQSLFQRITGFGMVRPSRDDELDEEIDREVEAAVEASLNVNPADRTALSGGDADLLDIPAFLRRQSNH